LEQLYTLGQLSLFQRARRYCWHNYSSASTYTSHSGFLEWTKQPHDTFLSWNVEILVIVIKTCPFAGTRRDCQIYIVLWAKGSTSHNLSSSANFLRHCQYVHTYLGTFVSTLDIIRFSTYFCFHHNCLRHLLWATVRESHSFAHTYEEVQGYNHKGHNRCASDDEDTEGCDEYKHDRYH
jgi:hypothetical protein